MNNNKIVLIIIGAVLFLMTVFLVLNLKGEEGPERKKPVRNYKVWIVGDEVTTFNIFLNKFKQASGYTNTQFRVESFSDFEEYYYSLTSAIARGEAPDMFVLNNNEKSLFEEQILGVGPSIITPSNFRKNYKRIFGDELILSSKDGDKELEFLKGVPIGYETLGIFYNRRYVNSKDLTSLSTLGNIISTLKKKNPTVVPIGIGDGSTVHNSADIMTQFFLLEDGVTGINDLNTPNIKSALSTYMMYGDKFGDNKYNSISENLKYDGETNLDLFSEGKTFMLVGYPRLLNKIIEKGFSKNFLEASVFPHYLPTKGKSLINYNYFVLNKESESKELGFELLQYMSSKEGTKEYLSVFPYYLPALSILEEELFEEKVDSDYKVILKDFYKFEHELSSFDKGVVGIYDKEIKNVLDDNTNYISQYENLNRKLKCKRDKFVTLENLSIACE